MMKLLISAMMAVSLLVSGGAMAQSKASDVDIASSNSDAKANKADKKQEKAEKKERKEANKADKKQEKAEKKEQKQADKEQKKADKKLAKVDKKLAKEAKKLTQRELKSLNAAKANIAAFANSNSNSKIAAIALYKESALETVAASNQYDTVSLNLESSLNVWRETKEQLDSLVNNYTGRLADDIKADLDALDPDSETYQADLASLEEEKTTYNAFVLSNNTLAGIVNEDVATVEANRVSLSTAEQQYEEALAIEQAILSEELNYPNLSVEALAELRSLLDL